MFTRAFWKDALERALKTLAQALVATLLVGVPLWSIDWIEVLGIGLTAAVISLLTSLASGGLGNKGTASITRAILPTPQAMTTRLIEFSDLVADRVGLNDTDQYVGGRHRLDP